MDNTTNADTARYPRPQEMAEAIASLRAKNNRLRLKNAELRQQVERLEAALREIRDDKYEDYSHNTMRGIAREALEGEQDGS